MTTTAPDHVENNVSDRLTKTTLQRHHMQSRYRRLAHLRRFTSLQKLVRPRRARRHIAGVNYAAPVNACLFTFQSHRAFIARAGAHMSRDRKDFIKKRDAPTHSSLDATSLTPFSDERCGERRRRLHRLRQTTTTTLYNISVCKRARIVAPRASQSKPTYMCRNETRRPVIPASSSQL